MSKSKVYFTDLRAGFGNSLQDKLSRLMLAAGFDGLTLERKYVAIKTHFGEPGNLAFLRPNYSKTVADMVKARGGAPYLTDCNTLYPGSRKNALDHMDAAYLNGFTPFSTGCHVIIGDGLKGTDEAIIPIAGEYVREAKIGRAVMDADVFVSLTHFKGHDFAGFGGALKNIGMGCGSRAGKMEMHSAGKPSVEQGDCLGCGVCVKNCAHGAVTLGGGKAAIDPEVCVGCGRCMCFCPVDAIHASHDEANDIMNKKIAEYTLAVVKNRPCFHISLVVDVSPSCDCAPCNDMPIVPDIGFFASLDPVALDVACADAVNAAPVMQNSELSEAGHVHGHGDYFNIIHPDSNWRACVEHAEKLGLGSQQYELVTVK